jgi:hypothetical protein
MTRKSTTTIQLFDGTEVEINFAQSTSLSIRGGILHKACSCCHQVKEASPSNFPRSRNVKIRIGATCLACSLARTRKYKTENTARYLKTIKKCGIRKFQGKGMFNRFQTFGKTTVIFCRKPSDGTVVRVLVDTADLPMIQKIDAEWLVNEDGYCWTPSPLAPRNTLHALLMGTPKGRVVDHISGRRHDNRRCNLRIVNHSDNGLNRIGLAAHNTSGYRGVFWNRRQNRWTATIRVSGRLNHLGNHRDFVEACKAVHSFLLKLGCPSINIQPVPCQSLAVAA